MRVLLVLLTLGTAGSLWAEDSTPPISLELLSEYHLPAGTRFEETCVGGLSALHYDPANDRYFAVSDGRREARFYSLRIEIAESDAGDEPRRPQIRRVTFDRVVRLKTREGLPYPEDRVDPEGFALLDARSAYVSSEGVARDGVPPFVDLVDVENGAWLSTIPLPSDLRPRHDGEEQIAGVRNNLGLESLTLSPDRRHLYAASESALVQDAGDLAAGVEHFARLLHFEQGTLTGQYLYPLVMPAGDILVHGLVELLAVDDAGRLLAMERTFARDVGLAVRLYEIRLSRVRRDVDRARLSPEARSLPVLDKRLILDFGELPILLENFEGLTFGPRLEDGSETLLIVGDNDNPGGRPAALRSTRFLLFALRRSLDHGL